MHQLQNITSALAKKFVKICVTRLIDIRLMSLLISLVMLDFFLVGGTLDNSE